MDSSRVPSPFLLAPGVFIAVLADVYISLVPDMGEKHQKVLKMALCDSWPYSYLVFKVVRNLTDLVVDEDRPKNDTPEMQTFSVALLDHFCRIPMALGCPGPCEPRVPPMNPATHSR